MPAQRANPAPPTNLLLCEQCGYPILPPAPPAHQPNCPECGKPTAESLPELRTGRPLTHNATWYASARALLRTPNTVYARVAIDTKASSKFHRQTMLLALLPFTFTSTVLIMLFYWYEVEPWTVGHSSILTLLLRVALFWFIIWVVAVGLAFLLILTLSTIERYGLNVIGEFHGYRITPNIARVITDYASIGWLIGSALLLPCTVVWSAMALFDKLGVRPPLLLRSEVALWYAIAAILIALVIHVTLAYIGLQRCKFANTPRSTEQPLPKNVLVAIGRGGDEHFVGK